MKTRCFFLLLSVIVLDSCSSTKNTGGTRWYHSFNTRYNVYFNGSQAYEEALKTQLEGYTENYSQMIYMHPVSSLAKNKTDGKTGGSFDKSLEKAVKAIKMHSLQTKPARNQSKARDPKYRAFLNRKEFNPFLHNAWMLMGQSQFFNGDFLEAASSFSYITRLYDSQPEIAIPAQLWKARSYTEMGWYYDADNILSKMNVAQLTKKQWNLYSTVYADYYVKQKLYTEAIPYLKTAVQSEKNRLQKNREKYLLGQLYTATNQKDLAYKIFGEVAGANVPYILSLNAKIRQTEVYPGGDINKISKQLTQMTKSSKNEQYLDQIYYAMGNVYMTVPDTAKAVESYESGVKKSTRNGIDKALNQVKLGDIYFTQRKYIKAQPNYSQALTQLKKSDEAYPRVSKRSEALDALVVPYQAVELQDSLQRLSKMTEDERMTVVKKIIAELIKKEKEEAKKAQQDQYQAQQQALQGQQQANRPNPPGAVNAIVPPTLPGSSSVFYFYNEQMVAVGKNMFQQKWGQRNLEDDWRRRNKTNPISASNEEIAENDSTNIINAIDSISKKTINPKDSLAHSADAKEASTDPHDPQFYLQQIPTTDEEIAASNLIISKGLYDMGVIYKDMLEDNPLALEAFQSLDTRFPDNENRLPAYYYMYLIYWQEGNMDMANRYKMKIREGFPNSDLAVAMSDPDYEFNQLTADSVQETLYQQTYADYLAGNSPEVRKNYETAVTKFSQSKLMPKFMLLNALSFAATNEADTFKVLLKQLVNKYPKDDVSALASDMIKGFQRGLLLSSSGDNMLARGSLFNMRFVGEDGKAVNDSTLQFSGETAAPHELLLIYPKGSLDDNVLYYTVAGYNFGNFTVNDFALEKTTAGEMGILQIKGFNSQGQVMQYLDKIQQPGGYAKDRSQLVIFVPISVENYSVLMKGKSMDEYMTFFEKQFGQGNENLIADWRIKQAEEMKVSSDTTKENLASGTGKNTNKETQPSKTTLPVDSIHTTLPIDTIHSNLAILPDSTDAATAKTDSAFDKTLGEVNDIYSKASNEMTNVQNKLNTIAADPVRGILNLFKRDKKNNAIEEFAKQQEKEEKEQQMQLKKEQDEKDKAAKAEALQKEKEQNAIAKKKAEEDKAVLKAKQQEQSNLAKKKADEKKQKENEKKKKESDRKQSAKEKQDALKKKIADRKAKEKARKEAQKQKAKEREQLRKQNEKEREELQKQKAKERKGKIKK